MKTTILIVLALAAVFFGALTYNENARRNHERQLIAAGLLCVSFKDTWVGPTIDKAWKPRKYDYGTHGSGIFCANEDIPVGVIRVGMLRLTP